MPEVCFDRVSGSRYASTTLDVCLDRARVMLEVFILLRIQDMFPMYSRFFSTVLAV